MTQTSDRWRYVPAVALAGAFLLLLAGLGVIIYNDRLYRDQQEGEIRTQAAVVAVSVTAALDFGDRSAAREYVTALRANHRVLGAAIYDGRGKLFVGYTRSGAPTPATLALAERDPLELMATTVPVLRDRTRIGSVHIDAAGDPLSRRLPRYAVIALMTTMAGLLIVVLALAHRALQREIAERARAEEQLRQSHKMQALGS